MQDVSPPGGFENPVNRVYATHGAQPYHTDSSDLVALLCLKPAKVGGYSTWASAYSIYNSLLQTQPELVEALAEEWYLDRKNEVPEGEGPWFKLPIYSWHKVSTCNAGCSTALCGDGGFYISMQCAWYSLLCPRFAAICMMFELV